MSVSSCPVDEEVYVRLRYRPLVPDRPDLLVLGDANPDLVLTGDVEPAFGQAERLVDDAHLTVGGSGAIVACGAARLGLRVGFCGVVGDDLFGRFLRDELERRGVEALAVVAPRRRVSSLRATSAAERLREGRTCYDHLAGRLGVPLTDALIARRALRDRNGAFDVTRSGERLLGSMGVDVGVARERRRPLALACADWTERRSHLAGALGAELCDRLFELGWIARRGSGRAVALTDSGSTRLRELIGLDVETTGRR